MTDKQLEQKEKELHAEMVALGFGWIAGNYIKPPKEYVLKQKELSCVDMINSILCYNCAGYQDANAVLEYEENAYYNYLADYVALLGRDKVLELIQGQIDSIAGVRHNVFTDSEGLSYSSLIWKDEQ